MPIQAKLLILILAISIGNLVMAQDEPVPATPAASAEPATPAEKPPADQPESPKEEPSTTRTIKDAASKLAIEAEAEAEKIAKKVDEDPRAKKTAAGILQPIYVVAKTLSFPAFHWLAFALMAAGVFSYALQLVLGKLVVLMRLGFSLKEIASDAVGLAISVVGLVLTTQAAAENSSFTQSPTAVISATVVGGILGIVLYFWGQSQELEAAAGRSRPVAPRKK